MYKLIVWVLAAVLVACAGCYTVHGVGQDLTSVTEPYIEK